MSEQTGRCDAVTRILVFAKAPVAGFAKTRLIPRLGAAGAARLAGRLLENAVAEAVAARLGPVELWTAPDSQHPAFQALSKAGSAELHQQGDGDLGSRMARAFDAAFSRISVAASGGRVLLIGTDAPGVDRNYLQLAAAALDESDAVFGPALDGGYTLVGLRSPAAALFENIAWSTAQVMSETRTRLLSLGLRHNELAVLSDIDEPADLRHLPAHWQPALAGENMPDGQQRADIRSIADPD